MKALMQVLAEINELTSNGGIKNLMQMKKEMFLLRNENEKLKKENKTLHAQLKLKDREISTLNSKLQTAQAVAAEPAVEAKRDESYGNTWMRKTDSDWKNNPRFKNDYPKESLTKNNSDNKIGLSSHISKNPSIDISAMRPSNPLHVADAAPHQSLYEKTLERMNHKQLYNKAADGKKVREPVQSHNTSVNRDPHHRHSAKKPTTSYLLNDSFDRNHRKAANEVNYNNYLNQEKRIGNLIRKPKTEASEAGVGGGASTKLRTTLLKRISSEDSDFSLEGSRRHADSRYSSSSAHQRDYSLEMYKKQMAKDKGQEYDPLGAEAYKELRKDSRPASRSISRSAKPIDISNDRIQVGKLFDYYKDPYD